MKTVPRTKTRTNRDRRPLGQPPASNLAGSGWSRLRKRVCTAACTPPATASAQQPLADEVEPLGSSCDLDEESGPGDGGGGWRPPPRSPCDEKCYSLGLRPPASPAAIATGRWLVPPQSDDQAQIVHSLVDDGDPLPDDVALVPAECHAVLVDDPPPAATPCDVVAERLRDEGRCACVDDHADTDASFADGPSTTAADDARAILADLPLVVPPPPLPTAGYPVSTFAADVVALAEAVLVPPRPLTPAPAIEAAATGFGGDHDE